MCANSLDELIDAVLRDCDILDRELEKLADLTFIADSHYEKD
jgi:hypothetical protein